MCPSDNVTLACFSGTGSPNIAFLWIPVACDYSKIDIICMWDSVIKPTFQLVLLGRSLGTQPSCCEWMTVYEEAPCKKELRPLTYNMVERPDDSQHQCVNDVSMPSWKWTLQSKIELPQLCHMEQRGAFRVKPWPNCRFISKVNDCYCSKLLSFEVDCYTVLTQN